METLLNSLGRTDIFSRFMSFKYLPRWVIFVGDLLVSLVAVILAVILAENLMINDGEKLETILVFRIALVVGVQALFYWIFHTYSGVLRYSAYVDAMKLLFSVFLAVLVLLGLNLFADYVLSYQMFYYTTILIYAVLAFFFLFMIRLIVKTTYDHLSMNANAAVPVMIYGTQSAGVAIAKLLRTNEKLKYRLVGFIDTEKLSSKKTLMGVKVYELNEDNLTKKIIKKTRTIIVSPTQMQKINPKVDLDVFIERGLSILRVPPMEIWEGGLPNVKQIKTIQIEDLLERPQIEISTENISQAIKNRVVLVTGATGSIGSEMVRQCVTFKPNLIVLLDQAESPMHELTLELKELYPNQSFAVSLGDVRNQRKMENVMMQYKPEIVFHAAAYKHVPLMEDNPTESIQANVLGTKNMADLSVKYGVSRFVMVSTDKAVNPTNVMGASKRICEMYIQSLNSSEINQSNENPTKFITTRFGNVLGSNGSVIPHFKRQIEKGGPVTVTHPEIIRYFMTIPEACLLVLEAGTSGNGGEIFIFDMGQPVKIVDLATKMIRLAGFVPNVDIKIEYTGLRQGEKLYEELLNQKEKTKETHHKKIMVANVREYNFEDINGQIEELIRCSYEGKNFLTVSQMKKIVPEFKSNNSIYEKLDTTIAE